ncbi:hypothetical protein RJ639_017445 [Escallonia herrerae]|uniref:Cytochrome P450 n=1 Tax=Escallonia herrerae TaxID=1293975 RepID=A0AA88VFB1_9ASTE|nr:hypothetical protein RJ639_017445 [Escallonia herrerae]
MATISDVQFYLSLFVIWFVSTLAFRSLAKKRAKSNHASKVILPPSPPALPLIGHLYLLSSVLPKSFKTLALKYGPIMRLRIGSSNSVVVSNATIAREILKNNEMSFVSRPDFGASDFNMYKGSEFVNADYGSYWRFLKKICMTQLLSAPQVNRFADIRREETIKLLEIFDKCSKEKKACDIGVELMTMTNNIICRMAMSTRCSDNTNESQQIWEFVKGVLEIAPKFSLGEMLGPLGKLDLFGYGRRLNNLFKLFDGLVEGIMVEKERNFGMAERKDMMDIMLEVYRDKNAEEIFMAGTEAMSVSMQWTLAELINHPELYKKLREEINTVVGSSRLVEESDVPNLPYLQAVVKESLRLHPAAPLIFRKCGEDCKIHGYNITKNDRVIFNLYAIMSDPNEWEDPTAFVPERFLGGSTETIRDYNQQLLDTKGQSFNNIPFGTGRRGCPGASLSSAVMQAAIATFVQCFDWEVEGGGKIDMELGPGLSSGMAQPLVCYPVTHVLPMEVTGMVA